MKSIDLNQLETATGGFAPVLFCASPYAPHCMPPAPAAAWRWAAVHAQYRAAAAYYEGFVPGARRWWW